MATNLTAMGVSASFGDGGLTLADKILQIQSFTNGLLLWADKDIIQTGDTVSLHALLLDNKISVAGETIKFDFGTIVSSKQVSAGDNIYDDYYVESSKTGDNYDYIGSGLTGFIQFNSQIIKTYVTSYSEEISYNGEPFHIKDGVLTYKDTSNNTQTIDVSAINTTKAYGGASFTVNYYWLSATTNTNGVATVSYSAKGAGKIPVQAKCGIISSKTCDLLDCIFEDDCTDNTKASSYIPYNNGVSTPIFDNTGMFAERTATGNGYLFITNTTYDLPFAIELEAVEIRGTVRLTLNNGDWINVELASDDNVKIEYYNDKQIVTINGTPTIYSKTNSDSPKIRVQFAGVSSAKLKNIMIYPI